MEATTLRMPEELSRFITEFAKSKGITRNSLIVQIFWEWKKRMKREELIEVFGEKNLIELEIEAYRIKKENL